MRVKGMRLGIVVASVWTMVSGFASSAQAEVTVQDLGDRVVYDVAIDSISTSKVTIDSKEFAALNLLGVEDHVGIVRQVGAPEIPVIRLFIEGRGTIEVTSAKGVFTDNLPEGLLLKPVLESVPKIAGAKVQLTVDRDAYGKASARKSLYDVVAAGSYRGQERRMVTLYPVRYDSTSGVVSVSQHFVVTFVRADKDGARTEVDGTPVIAFVIGKKFAKNPSLEAYMTFKTTLGFKVAKIVVGTDATTAQQIRGKLQDLLKNTTEPLRYAVLIGDIEDVPAFPSANMSGSTDHYYRAIDTADYAADIGAPDIGVGRISATSEAQLDGILAKYTRYTQGQFANTDWMKSLSFLATSDSGYYKVAEGTHNYVVDTYSAGRGYLGIFPKDPQSGGDKLYAITNRATTTNVMKSAQAGRGMIIYSGHGGSTSWVGPAVSQSDVRAMSHADALPFVTGFACNTAMFSTAESFAETWQRHPKGAVFYWGSWDSSLWDEDDILERRMMDAIFKDGVRDFGTITNQAQIELWKNQGGLGKSKYYMESYAVFADPSMELRLPSGS